MTKMIMENTPEEERELQEQRRLGLSLYGNLVRFHEQPAATARKCTRVFANGMVEVEGYSGIFAPHLFTIERVLQIPMEGQVQ
jgi:hypothetical protein